MRLVLFAPLIAVDFAVIVHLGIVVAETAGLEILAHQRPTLNSAEPIIAGVDGQPRNPMGKGLVPSELIEFQEDFSEGLLGNVLMVGISANLIANNF